MHYFKFNIGDYHKKAGRLTMIEHGAYTLLLHACYDRECFPTKEEAIDWCWARTADEVAAVEFVLGKFFRLEDGRYVQDRIMEEIDAYHEKAEKNRHIALEREEKRRTKRERNVHDTSPKTHEAPPNQEPRNQEPILSSDTDVSESSGQAVRKKHGSKDDHKAAHWMFERVQRINHAAKEPNWNTWANDVRLMREIDGRTHADICELFDWANRDSFWCGNVLCPAKLREKWDQLVVQRSKAPPARRPAAENFAGKNYGESRDL